jgi:hypothetical protein
MDIDNIVKPIIRKNIEEAEALLTQGHTRAALVLGWATIEAIARTLNPNLPSFGPRTTRGLGIVGASGTVALSAGPGIAQAVALRDKIVHGDFGTAVTAAEVEAVVKAARAALEAA